MLHEPGGGMVSFDKDPQVAYLNRNGTWSALVLMENFKKHKILHMRPPWGLINTNVQYRTRNIQCPSKTKLRTWKFFAGNWILALIAFMFYPLSSILHLLSLLCFVCVGLWLIFFDFSLSVCQLTLMSRESDKNDDFHVHALFWSISSWYVITDSYPPFRYSCCHW